MNIKLIMLMISLCTPMEEQYSNLWQAKVRLCTVNIIKCNPKNKKQVQACFDNYIKH